MELAWLRTGSVPRQHDTLANRNDDGDIDETDGDAMAWPDAVRHRRLIA